MADAVGAVPALVVAVPLVGACLLLALGAKLPRVAVDAVATTVAVAVTVLLSVLLGAVRHGRVVSWVGGHRPEGVRSVGIVLVADGFSTLLGLLTAVLTVCVLLYGRHYFDAVEARFHAMMLLFLTGMLGFLMVGDLFTMFVFFELMSGVAYALTGYRVEEADTVQGALNFGVVNSLGAYFTLMGIGFVYARTGQLGLAQVGTALDGRPPDRLVVVALALVCTGLLVKAAAAPFHFWLADAHAVAPTPVCVLFSGVMVELGVYGVVRVHGVVFHQVPMTGVLVVLGAASAVLGSVLCITQRHLKRLLAYSTIAHVGLFLCGPTTMDGEQLAGLGLSTAGHAGAKGALFLLTGILLNRYRSVDTDDLFGRVTRARGQAWLFLLAGLALAGLPPFGPALGKEVTEEAAPGWLMPLSVAVSAVTGAAVLQAGVRVYFGLGEPPRESGETTPGTGEEPETGGHVERTPRTMVTAAGLLLLVSLAVGVVPAVRDWAAVAGAQAADRAGYLHDVLPSLPGSAPGPIPEAGWTRSGVVSSLVGVLLAAGLAAAALWWHRLRMPRQPWLGRVMHGLHQAHSGHLGDYVAWLLFGVAAMGVLLLA